MGNGNMWDQSGILLQNRGGDNLARGIESASFAIGRGLEQRADKRQQRQRTEKALSAMDPEGAKEGKYASMSLGQLEGELDAAAMKRVKAADERAAAEAKRREQIETFQLGEMLREQEAQKREEAARSAAMAPIATTRQRTPAEGLMVMRDPNIAENRQPTGEEAVMAYLKAGGSMRGAGNVADVYSAMQRLGFNPQSGEGKLIADAAALKKAGRNTEADALLAMATKGGDPLPGSKGYDKRTLPDGGTIVVDLATGKPVNQGDINRGAGSAKLTESEVAFETNTAMALKGLKNLRKTVNDHGTWESEWFGNPKAAADLDQSAYQLAIQYAKIVDPSSVAREGEVAAAQKYMIPLGRFASKKKALAAIDSMEKTIAGYMAERAKVRGGSGDEGTPAAETKATAAATPPPADGVPVFNDEAAVEAALASGALKPGGFVRIGGKKFRVE